MSAPKKVMCKWRKLDNIEGPIPKSRHGHRAISFKDMMIIFGGGNDGFINELHVFRTSNNQWYVPNMKGELPPGCAAYGFATDGSNRVLLFGGMLEFDKCSGDLFELRLNNWEWKRIKPKPPRDGNPPPQARFGHSFTYIDNRIYLFGGLAKYTNYSKQNTFKYLNDLYVLELKAHPHLYQWEKPMTCGKGPSPRESHTTVAYTPTNGDGPKLIIYGGMNGMRLGDIYILDINSMTWNNPVINGIPPLPRSLHSSTVINKKMYVFGGWVPQEILNKGKIEIVQENEWRCSNTLAILDLEKLEWNECLDDTVPSARAGHSAVAIDSRLYIWSGRDEYRKCFNKQALFNDLWFLETGKPNKPMRPTLSKVMTTTFEISWDPVPSTDAYIVQLMKFKTCEAPVSSIPEPNNPLKSTKPITITNNVLQPNTKQPNMKKFISFPKLQLTTTEPMSISSPAASVASINQKINPSPTTIKTVPFQQNIRVIAPQMLPSGPSIKLTQPSGQQQTIRIVTSTGNIGAKQQILLKTGNMSIPNQMMTIVKTPQGQLLKMVPTSFIKSSGANIITSSSVSPLTTSSITTPVSTTGIVSFPRLLSSNEQVIRSVNSSTAQPKPVINSSHMKKRVIGSTNVSRPPNVSNITTATPNQQIIRLPAGVLGSKSIKIQSGLQKNSVSCGQPKILFSGGQPLKLINSGSQRIIMLSSNQSISNSSASVVNTGLGNQPNSKEFESHIKIPQTDGPDDEPQIVLPPIIAPSSANVNSTAEIKKEPGKVIINFSNEVKSDVKYSKPTSEFHKWYDIGLFEQNQILVNDYYVPDIGYTEYDAESDILNYKCHSYEKFSKVNLKYGTVYKIRVAAINNCGRGPWSEILGVKTSFPGYPPPPMTAKITRNTQGVLISWCMPPNTAKDVNQYEVFLAIRSPNNISSPDQTSYIRVYSGPELFCEVPTKQLDEAYIDEEKPSITFRIVAKNEKGFSSPTQVRLFDNYNSFTINLKRNSLPNDTIMTKKPKNEE